MLWLTVLSLAGHALTKPTRQEAVNQVSRYDLSIKVAPQSRRIEVEGRWELPASSKERETIEFYLSPKMRELEVKILEPKAAHPLSLQSNREEGGDIKWVFKPARPVAAGQAVLLQFSYASDGKSAPQLNISTEGSFAGGGGELWYPQSAFKDRETGTLRFAVPAGETVISNGALSSSPAQRAAGEYIFNITRPSKFGFASGRYSVIRRAGKVAFSLYLLRPRTGAPLILNNAARALETLASLYGDFPYSDFSFVEVNFPGIVTGTSEFGFILADDSKLDEFDLAYWAHEMGHQWWGNAVRSASGTTGQMMLSEGVTQFGALQAVEAVEGEAAATEFRRRGYKGEGHSAESYFKLAGAGRDFPLTSHIPKNQNETLTMHTLANTKGFILLDMLSRRIGRAKFASILRRFVRRSSNQATSWQAFRQAVEEEAGQDLSWFFEQWFERVGAPDYRMTWKQEGSRVRVMISQPAPHFRTALELELSGGGRRLLRTVEVSGGAHEFNLATPFKVDSVELDPRYKVLRWLPEFRAR